MIRIFSVLIILFLMTGNMFARQKNKETPSFWDMPTWRLSRSTETGSIDTEFAPSLFNVTWAGVGDLAKFTINNTGESGYYYPPVSWDGSYDGSNYDGWYTYSPVRCGEFPAGSDQFYIYDAGLWVGAIVPDPESPAPEPRVAACAYSSDLSSVFPVYTSTQFMDADGDFAGQLRFAQYGADSKQFEEQDIWVFTDTSLNARRREIEEERGLTGLTLKPGDLISNQDTYTAYGDYVPEDEAMFAYSGGYQMKPVGVRIIQRTYSWGYDYNNRFIYLDFYVTNMNDFALDSVYFGYFMDTDIGDGDEPQGAKDDLIGYDEGLNLGYCYDSDLYEPGWETQSGYIGVTFLETPKDNEGNALGLTGFQTWDIDLPEGQETDKREKDLPKYEQLSKGGYEAIDQPMDVRMLPCSGPIVKMEPGETTHLVLAVMVGNSLAELKENAVKAKTQYDDAYVSVSAPPMPDYSLTPADQKVYINWIDNAEHMEDPLTGEVDFEGYRIYRSTSGITGTWDLVADFDKAGNQTGRVAVAKIQKSTSICEIAVDSIDEESSFYTKGEYTINMIEGKKLTVYNLSTNSIYPYKKAAARIGNSFCIYDSEGDVQDDASYVSGARIYFDGVYVVIKDGVKKLPIDDIDPNEGDVFWVKTYNNNDIGDQTGLAYTYVDSGLVNGITYYYSMTAYDRGDLKNSISPLETGIEMNKKSIVPTTLGADVNDATVSDVEHSIVKGNGAVSVQRLTPIDLDGHAYKVVLGKSDSSDSPYDMAEVFDLIDVTNNNSIVWDGVDAINGQGNPEYAGMSIKVATDPVAFDSIYWEPGETDMELSVISAAPVEPYSFEIRFTENGAMSKNGVQAPFEVWNVDADSMQPFIYIDMDPKGELTNGEPIKVAKAYGNGFNFDIKVLVDEGDTSPPQTGDIYRINVKKPLMVGDEFTFSSTKLKEKKKDYSLDNIKVVPNPYYIREDWDYNRFSSKIYFQNLPSKCTIRIFNTAGLLIRTLEHDSPEKEGSEPWNLRTEENADAVNGLYIFQVEDDKGKTKVGKFSIIR